MAVRVDGLDDALRLIDQFPGQGRSAQRGLILQTARGLRRGIKQRLKRTAPRRRGTLQRSIAVRVDRNPPTIVISGSRAMVPSNARTGYLSKELNALPRRMDAEVVSVIQERIDKLTR